MSPEEWFDHFNADHQEDFSPLERTQAIGYLAQVWEDGAKQHRGGFKFGTGLPPNTVPIGQADLTDRLLAALRELVALKALKERFAHGEGGYDAVGVRIRLEEDYKRRQPLAWATARDLLTSLEGTTPAALGCPPATTEASPLPSGPFPADA